MKAKSIKLSEGSYAEDIGEGVFVICQPSEAGPQSVVMSLKDVRRLLFRS